MSSGALANFNIADNYAVCEQLRLFASKAKPENKA
jgi:hypothetical protein